MSESRQLVSEWRSERYEPDDQHAPCNYCNSMRFIIASDGARKPCPVCHVAQGWKTQRTDAYSSNAGKSKAQTFDTFKVDTPALKTLRNIVFDYATNPHGWLVIHGAPGNGKTHLCAAAHNELAARGVDCIFVSMPDLIASLKSLFDESTSLLEHQTYSQRLRIYQAVEVLVIDDLGAERQTDWTNGVLFELLDYRYRNQLATLISTNQDPNDKLVFDARLISRWHDSAFSTVIRNTAADYRMRRSAAKDKAA